MICYEIPAPNKKYFKPHWVQAAYSEVLDNDCSDWIWFSMSFFNEKNKRQPKYKISKKKLQIIKWFL